MPLQGLDVSSHQESIDWCQVAGWESTYGAPRFAGIKATEGDYYSDPYFGSNWRGAKAAGLQRIAYHFFDPVLSGEGQARYFHGIVRNHGHFEVGDAIMLDLEQTKDVAAAVVVQRAEAFVSNLLAQTRAGIYLYTNATFWESLENPASAVLGRCPLWAASYGAAPAPISNWPTGYTIWQYGDAGQVPGISGAVDLDVFEGDMTTYNLLARQGGRH